MHTSGEAVGEGCGMWMKASMAARSLRAFRAARWVLFLTPWLLLVMYAGVPAGEGAELPPSPPPQVAPPRCPSLNGQITGVAEDMEVIIQVRRLSGELRFQYPSRVGNGYWGVVGGQVPVPEDVQEYVVTAEAASYVSEPPRYTIRVQGCTLTVLETWQVTTADPRHLDFHFRPATSPPPAPGGPPR